MLVFDECHLLMSGKDVALMSEKKIVIYVLYMCNLRERNFHAYGLC